MPKRGRCAGVGGTSARCPFLVPLLFSAAGTLHAADTVVAADPVPSLELSLPIDCNIGKTCFIQNFVDAVKGTGVRDFGCGKATYDGHKGTDFRLISTADVVAGVSVLAAARGIVKGTRDSMPDLLYTKAREASLAGRDCGNGVRIDHGSGWETQYCHLRRGSIKVRHGERVTRGTPLGEVGYSGKAAFAHLHLSVRHNRQVVDPFTGQSPSTSEAPSTGQKPGTSKTPAGAGTKPATAPGAACAKTPIHAGSLWSPKARQALRYRSGQIIEVGFSGARMSKAASEAGLRRLPRPTRSSPVIIFAVRAIKLQTGDKLHLGVTGPGGFRLQTTTAPTKRTKATRMSFIGRKRKAGLWPSGVYKGQVRLLRKGRVLSFAQASIEIR